jgi:hypothetical protein
VKTKKRQAKLLLIVEFHAEARPLVGKISAHQRHFLQVAAAHGKELEPSGWLADGRARLAPPKRNRLTGVFFLNELAHNIRNILRKLRCIQSDAKSPHPD